MCGAQMDSHHCSNFRAMCLMSISYRISDNLSSRRQCFGDFQGIKYEQWGKGCQLQ